DRDPRVLTVAANEPVQRHRHVQNDVSHECLSLLVFVTMCWLGADHAPGLGRVSSVIGQDAVGEVLRARCHLGFEQLEAHRRVAWEEGSAATEDEGCHMDGHHVGETGLLELLTRAPPTHYDDVPVA